MVLKKQIIYAGKSLPYCGGLRNDVNAILFFIYHLYYAVNLALYYLQSAQYLLFCFLLHAWKNTP